MQTKSETGEIVPLMPWVTY